jgi:hypothetical protein
MQVEFNHAIGTRGCFGRTWTNDDRSADAAESLQTRSLTFVGISIRKLTALRSRKAGPSSDISSKVKSFGTTHSYQVATKDLYHEI